MQAQRATWTDERLDDLSRRVDAGFDRLDADIRGLSARIDSQGASLGARIDSQGADLVARIDRIDSKLDALQRSMTQFAGVMMAGLLGTIMTVIATRV